jgi:hypothetical protein
MNHEFNFTSILNNPVNDCVSNADTEKPVTGELIEFRSIASAKLIAALKRMEEIRSLVESALIESEVA